MIMLIAISSPKESSIKIILLTLLTLSSITWGQTMNNKTKFQHLFENLNKDTMHLVADFYDKDIEFHDPVGTIKGLDGMTKYYQNMYKNVKTIKFEFSEIIESGETVVGVWKMTLTTDKLNGGDPIVVDGNSVVHFKNGKATYHRDYFDMGAFAYEHIPALGFVVKKVKERFKAEP